jgi:Flp pilus assembly protein TadD
LSVLSSSSVRRISTGRWLRAVATATLLGALGGCDSASDITGSIEAKSETPPTSPDALRAYADQCAKRYNSDPGGKMVSINYAKALRALTRYHQASAVMESAAVKAPNDRDVLSAYGKALADDGQLAQAADVLTRSYTPEEPDWSSMNAQGSIADKLGDHSKAQDYYRDALKLAPGEPAILNNLGLSYALTKQLPRAEEALRQAVASPRADARTRANLGLILALEGKFGEAEKIQNADSSASPASDVASIRRMISQNNSWREIQALDSKKGSGGLTPASSAAPVSASAPQS